MGQGQGRPRVNQHWRSAAGKGMPNTSKGTMLIAGVTEWGPEAATACSSWAQWKTKFGWFLSAYETAIQVYIYFLEANRAGRGGKVITKRVLHYADHTAIGATPATAARGAYTLLTGGVAPYGNNSTLLVQGKYYGSLALTVQIAAATSGKAAEFDLLVYHPRQVTPIERFRNLTMDTAATRYAVTVINTVEESNYIIASDMTAIGTPTQQRPANLAAPQPLIGGNDGLTAINAADYTGGTASKTGLYGFNLINEGNTLIVPDINTAGDQDDFTDWCRVSKGGKVAFITDSAQSAAKSTVIAHAGSLTASLYRTGIYWPHVKVANPDKSVYGQADTITVRPSGGIAGRVSFLANDGYSGDTRGVFISPSNESYGWIESFVGLEGTGNHEVLDTDVQDEVHDYGINMMLSGKNIAGRQGAWALGCKIGDPEDTEIASTGNLFGLGFLRARYEAFLQPHVTQDNSEDRRATVEDAIDSDLAYYTGRGCFATRNKTDAYSVDFDPEGEGINNPLEQITGNVWGIIGIAFSSPGNFWNLVFTKEDGAVKSYMMKASQGG